MYAIRSYYDALARGLAEQACLTDEASAMERVGIFARMVEGRADNIKVTRPEDRITSYNVCYTKLLRWVPGISVSTS